MDTILSIFKYLFFFMIIATIFGYANATSWIKRIVYLLVCIFVYSNFGMIPLVIVFGFILTSVDKDRQNRLKKNIFNFIDRSLNEGKIISRNKIGSLIMQEENMTLDDKDAQKRFIDDVIKYSDEHMEELLGQNSQIQISKVAVSGDVFYLTVKSLGEIQEQTEALRQYAQISPNNLGYRGVSGMELVNVCRQLVPSFPFITCRDDNDTLINIDYLAYYKCAKCHGVFKNLTNYYGTKYCSNCVQTVQKAERTGETVVLEVTPDQIPMSGDMADVFAELDKK